MSQVQSNGGATGNSCQALSAMSAGAWCALALTEAPPLVKVTVTGQTPASGKVFMLNLDTGVVAQLVNSQVPAIQYGGAYAFSSMMWVAMATDNASARDTLGDVVLKEFFDTSGDGDVTGPLCQKVSVLDENGDAIAPTSGKSWRFAFDGTSVDEVLNSTVVERYGADTTVLTHKLQ